MADFDARRVFDVRVVAADVWDEKFVDEED